MSPRILSLVLLCSTATCIPAFAGTLEDINAITAKGQTAFVVLIDDTVADPETARKIAKAAQERTADSSVVTLNRSDPEQKRAVDKLRVSGAPVPLVLVIASNGLTAGAAKPDAQGAVDRLVGLVPSPAKADYLRILSQGQVAMTVFSRRSMKEQSPLFEQITLTSRMRDLKMGTVLVDLDDDAESRFIEEWDFDPEKIERPLLIFVNPKGQVLGQLEGVPTAAQMTEMAKKKIRGCQDPNCKDPNCRHGK